MTPSFFCVNTEENMALSKTEQVYIKEIAALLNSGCPVEQLARRSDLDTTLVTRLMSSPEFAEFLEKTYPETFLFWTASKGEDLKSQKIRQTARDRAWIYYQEMEALALDKNTPKNERARLLEMLMRIGGIFAAGEAPQEHIELSPMQQRVWLESMRDMDKALAELLKLEHGEVIG